MSTGKKTRGLVTGGDYSNIANFRIKILAMYQGTFGTFHIVVTYLCIYTTISRVIHDDVPLNHDWETLQ